MTSRSKTSSSNKKKKKNKEAKNFSARFARGELTFNMLLVAEFRWDRIQRGRCKEKQAIAGNDFAGALFVTW